MNLNARQRLLAVLAIVAVGLWLGDRLVFTPLVKSWQARTVRLTTLRKSVTQGTLLLERERTIRERWGQMRTNTLSKPLSQAESQVLQAFDRWSRDSGVSISSIRPQWKRGGDDFSTIECRADAAGTLGALTRFLYLIEKDPLAFKVEAVELATRDNDGQQLTLALQVSGLLLGRAAP